MTGQIAGHQPPDETGGAEHHHVQLTVSAHPFILGKLRAAGPPAVYAGLAIWRPGPDTE